jgi:hypothetical protein
MWVAPRLIRKVDFHRQFDGCGSSSASVEGPWTAIRMPPDPVECPFKIWSRFRSVRVCALAVSDQRNKEILLLAHIVRQATRTQRVSLMDTG